MHNLLLYNGAVRGAGESLLSPGQVGFMNGWGVFSTLRVCDGVLFAYERHYQRIKCDAALMRVPFDISEASLETDLLQLIEANHAFNATLRVAVIRNKGGLYEGSQIKRSADVIAFTTDLNDWGSGAKLTSIPNTRFAASPFAGTKITSWAQNLTLYETAHERGFDEALLLNERGGISECTSANLFIIQNDRVWTPPLKTSGCLPGVTRAILLEEVQIPGFTIAEREILPSELVQAEQVFITSSTRDLLPVLEVDGVRLPQNRQKLATLQDAFINYRSHYVAGRKQHKEI